MENFKKKINTQQVEYKRMNKNESIFFLTAKDLPGRENKLTLMFEKHKFFS